MQAASGFDVFTQSVTESLSLATLATFNTLTFKFTKTKLTAIHIKDVYQPHLTRLHLSLQKQN